MLKLGRDNPSFHLCCESNTLDLRSDNGLVVVQRKSLEIVDCLIIIETNDEALREARVGRRYSL